MMGSNIQHLAWDSHWLGFPVARVVGEVLNAPACLPDIVAQCQATGVRLLYLIFDPAQQPTAEAAQALGVQLVDNKRTYSQLIDGVGQPITPVNTHLFQVDSITPALRSLAVQSGEYSRFRLDKRIGATAFEELYMQWLDRSLLQGQVWAVATPSDTVGLLAYAGHEHYASIELLAVDAGTRRRGIGQCLVQAAQQAAQQQGYAQLQVATQGANQPAWHLYERCGFQLLRTELIYHLWL